MDILIVEDEVAASKRLEGLILKIEPNVNVLARLECIDTTVDWLKSNSAPDLIFMDIHLADGLSFEIFKQVNVNAAIIFTTAYNQYALDAFKVNSIDYLLKPIKKEELQKSIEKYYQLDRNKNQSVDFEALTRALSNGGNNYQERILVRYGQQLKAVEMEETAYFYTEEKVVFLCTNGEKRYPIDFHLDQLEVRLDPKVFFRINRQFIINIKAISEMHAYSKSRVKIKLSPACKLETVVSTDRSPLFKKWLTGDI